MGQVIKMGIKQIQVTGSTQDSQATIDIPENAEIIAISGALRSIDAILGELVQVEVSFLSSNQLNVNDARGSIFVMNAMATGGTGSIGYAVNHSVSFANAPIDLNAGERLHLHIQGTAVHTAFIDVILFLNLLGGGRRTVRRR